MRKPAGQSGVFHGRSCNLYPQDVRLLYCCKKKLLSDKGVAFRELDATFDFDIKQEMMQKSGRRTFPQIFINDAHIGGCDDLFALDKAGKLDPMLAV